MRLPSTKIITTFVKESGHFQRISARCSKCLLVRSGQEHLGKRGGAHAWRGVAGVDRKVGQLNLHPCTGCLKQVGPSWNQRGKRLVTAGGGVLVVACAVCMAFCTTIAAALLKTWIFKMQWHLRCGTSVADARGEIEEVRA